MNRSGQVLMMALLIFMVFLIAIPVVVFINHNLSRNSGSSQTQTKGRLVAEEATAVALQQLKAANNWPYANAGGMPAGSTLQSVQGGTFNISYSSAPYPGLKSYQVGILSQAVDGSGRVIPGSSVLSASSQLTVGARLPGYSLSAALDLAKVPIEPILTGASAGATPVLRVEFGPIVIRDSHTWALDNYNANAANERPRKILAGSFSGRTKIPTPLAPTDKKEYWAYISPGFSPVIDLAAYQARAQGTTDCSPSIVTSCQGCVGSGQSAPGNCYYDTVGFGTATIKGLNKNFGADSVIYVKGNIQIEDNTDFNLGDGALIVTGNLILGRNGASGNTTTPTTVYVPPTVGYEDPYCTCADPACIGVVYRKVNMNRAFIFVGQNMYVTTSAGSIAYPESQCHWTLEGVVRVEGRLRMDPLTSLYIFYNDIVNHKILTRNFEVQIDTMTAVP